MKISIKFESYISKLYIETKEYTNKSNRKINPSRRKGHCHRRNPCTRLPWSYQTTDRPPCVWALPLHGEKKQSVTITRSSKRRLPWHVTATHQSPITHTAEAINDGIRKHQLTHLSGACLSEAYG